MERTTSPNNQANLFSEGNPGLGIPATTVSALDMNNFQEEIINTILASGQALSTDKDQLSKAVISIASAGGDLINESILNNQAGTDVPGLVIDKDDFKAASVFYEIERSDDDPTTVNQAGYLFLSFDSVNLVWKIADMSDIDDVGVTFSITAAGQVKYDSTNFTGGAYAGSIRATLTKLAK